MHVCKHAAPFPDSGHAAHGIGSLWDPNITVETLEAHQLRLSFTPWNESTSYQVLLHSFRLQRTRAASNMLSICSW